MTGNELIVNADDFGWSEAVNRGIVECHRRGIVTSASLMANGVAFDHAVAAARDNPTLGVGVHLNLLRGRALSKVSRVPALTDAAGRFVRGPTRLVLAILTRRVPAVEVEREWSAQIERVLGAGIVPTHLDSEKNLHGLPILASIVVKLAQRYDIRAVRRVTFEAPLTGATRQAGFYRMAALAAATGLGLGWPRAGGDRLLARHTVGMSLAGHLNAEVLCSLIRRLPPGPCELMVHPGYVDDSTRRASADYGGHVYIDAHREQELAALTDARVLETCRDSGWALVTFGGLA